MGFERRAHAARTAGGERPAERATATATSRPATVLRVCEAAQDQRYLDRGFRVAPRVDHLVARERFRNRSQAVETALAEKLARLARTRLAEECAKLDPAEERQLASEALGADAAWPEY